MAGRQHGDAHDMVKADKQYCQALHYSARHVQEKAAATKLWGVLIRDVRSRGSGREPVGEGEREGGTDRYIQLVKAGGKGLQGQPFSAGAIAAHLPGSAQGTSNTSHHLGIGLLQNVTRFA